MQVINKCRFGIESNHRTRALQGLLDAIYRTNDYAGYDCLLMETCNYELGLFRGLKKNSNSIS